MINELKSLSLARGVSGDEAEIRGLIEKLVCRFADSVRTDAAGNLIAFRKGEKSNKKLMLAAHMDEVGFIIKTVEDSGLLRFEPMGGIDPRVILGRRVLIGEKRIPGVIGTKSVHLQDAEERKRAPEFSSLYIDVGAKDGKAASKKIEPGDTAVFDGDFVEFGEGLLKGKALDNRCGCYCLVEAIKEKPYFDTYYVFTVMEEIGLRGAFTAANSIEPDYAVTVDTTTAADFEGIPKEKTASVLGGGAVIFFMESTTIYDKALVSEACAAADAAKIKWQYKNVVAGGLDSGAIQRSGTGVATIAIATPCRYLHSPSCVISKEDLNAAERLLKLFVKDGVPFAKERNEE